MGFKECEINLRDVDLQMNTEAILIWAYYIGLLALALVTGFTFGFSDSHTAPLPFVIELFTMLVGVIWLVIDIAIIVGRKEESMGRLNAHLIGFALNGVFIVYLLN